MKRLTFFRRLARGTAIAALAVLVVLLSHPREAATAPADLVARGLDLFLHAPASVAPGASFPVATLAIGFPTLATTTPLEGAQITASWTDTSLDLERSGGVAPPPVEVRTDARGRAVLQVQVPEGGPRTLSLLVRLRLGDKERLRTIDVERIRRDEVDLLLGESRVVPGGTTTAWALVRDVATGVPRAGARVELRLLEGSAERHRAEATTDAGGTAAFRVPIPASREPAIGWELVARLASPEPEKAAQASVSLRAREETPAQPQLKASFDASSVRPGTRAAWRVRLRDAADAAVARTEVRVWTGPDSVSPPDEEVAWRKASTPLASSLDGEVRGAFDAPGLVPAAGADWKLVARASIGGMEVRSESRVHVGRERASIALRPEAGKLIPGLEQRVFLELLGEDDRPLAGTFRLRGDGLDATAKLDAHGQAEIAWKTPAGIGGFRGVGPCSGGVAAAVDLTPADEAARTSLAGAKLAGWDDLPLCVAVDRDAELLVRVDPPVARAGAPVRVSVRGSRGRGASVVVSTEDGGRSLAAWAPDAEAGVELAMPAGANGIVRVDVAVPRDERPALVASGSVLVVPTVLPRVEGTMVGGSARPGGRVMVEARVHDGRGAPLPGTVAVVVIDRFGGGSLGGLSSLDARGTLCGRVGVRAERCDELLEGAVSVLGRERVAGVRRSPLDVELDPGAAISAEATRTFRAVVHSLEGAVYEASNEPARLADVRRREGTRWGFNPELLTLVTSAMDPPPLTPGGEPIALADLIGIDRQITFDHVARRITRLKLYQVLQAIHEHRRAEGLLDPAEPALRDAGAMLRRLVREGAIGETLLADPWGGQIVAVKADARDGLPFLRPAPGWELRSPGPDGRVGNADDVRDPFERVLTSGSPYALAVDEDRLVDARLDMRVADATVANWRSLLESLTGTTLGGLSLSGVGHGGSGSGQGFGSGSGRLGGHGRGTSSIPSGIAFWSGPRRTDARGVVRIEVPLGDIETTWTIGLVAVPDGARTAFSSIQVVSTLPLSASVDAGARWIEGDRLGVAVTLKNRTAADVDATLAVALGGALTADGAAPPTRVRVPRQGVTTVRVPARATRAGAGQIEVRLGAPGLAEDRLTHTVTVARAGEELLMSRSAFVADQEVSLRSGLTRPGLVPLGPATLVLERADAGVLRAAVDALDPDQLQGDADLADAADVGTRVAAWSTARLGERDPLTVAALRTRDEAIGRLVSVARGRGNDAYASSRRARRWTADPEVRKTLGARDECPSEKIQAELSQAALLDLLDAEPALEDGAMLPCWGSFVGARLGELKDEPIAIARAIASLAERRHRAEDVRSLGVRLAELVRLQPSGAVALTGGRAERALVYAALLRVPPQTLAADRAALLSWLLVQRDARGGFGSGSSTRAAVRALLAPSGGLDARGAVEAKVTTGDDTRSHAVATDRPLRLPLDAATDDVAVEAPAPGVFARVERRFLRPWTTPAPESDSSLHLVVRWPEARAGSAAPVRLVVARDGRGKRLVDVRVHLPPGAHLAAPVGEVRELQGQLLWRVPVGDVESFVEVPIRFDLAGTVTIPEATAQLASGGTEPARAPARPLTISPR